uniref:Acetolactate synthase small subunit n=1 Tax=Mallomonas splendens TaxID=52552 RepID=A0A3G2QZQ9_9STRA|nr:acetohydroxyacid synthase small subunit [Mallomonas splendens]AYO28489.1 acetohydroxyacid synthase small subunit [Mallomonas splendens]
MKKTLSITVFNESGVLTRISTMFSSRGFNIESIAVGPTETPGISKIIIILPADTYTLEQVIKQLNKLVQVIEVKDLSSCPCVERELMLIKIKASPIHRSEIIEIAEIFKARIVDLSDISITMEVTGDPGKIVTIQELLKRYTILEIVRSGKISIQRELGINTEFLKNL